MVQDVDDPFATHLQEAINTVYILFHIYFIN